MSRYRYNESVRNLNPSKPVKPKINKKKVTFKELNKFRLEYCSYYEINDCCEECKYYLKGCFENLIDDNFEIIQVIK